MSFQIEVVGEHVFARMADELTLSAVNLANMRFDAVYFTVGLAAMVACEGLVSSCCCLIIYFDLTKIRLLPAEERDNDFLIVRLERLDLRLGRMFRSF